jgi:hypothetical protein
MGEGEMLRPEDLPSLLETLLVVTHADKSLAPVVDVAAMPLESIEIPTI